MSSQKTYHWAIVLGEYFLIREGMPLLQDFRVCLFGAKSLADLYLKKFQEESSTEQVRAARVILVTVEIKEISEEEMAQELERGAEDFQFEKERWEREQRQKLPSPSDTQP